MQYILTQKEYDDLVSKKEYKISPSKSKLQKLCTKIANEMPVKVSWLMKNNGGFPAPWGCILTKGYEWYCDECPVRTICPSDKQHYSK